MGFSVFHVIPIANLILYDANWYNSNDNKCKRAYLSRQPRFISRPYLKRIYIHRRRKWGGREAIILLGRAAPPPNPMALVYFYVILLLIIPRSVFVFI